MFGWVEWSTLQDFCMQPNIAILTCSAPSWSFPEKWSTDTSVFSFSSFSPICCMKLCQISVWFKGYSPLDLMIPGGVVHSHEIWTVSLAWFNPMMNLSPSPIRGKLRFNSFEKKKLIIEGYMRCMGKLDYIMTSSFNISVCQFGGIDCHISIFKLDHWHIYMPSKPYQNNFLNIFILWHHKTQYSACPNASSFKIKIQEYQYPKWVPWFSKSRYTFDGSWRSITYSVTDFHIFPKYGRSWILEYCNTLRL